jgi:thiamine kinase-like enzyme
MNLSGSVLKCEIIPLKIRKSRAVLEFKLQMHSKKSNQSLVYQQPTYKSVIAKWRRDGKGKEIFNHLQQVWHRGFDRRARDDDHLKMYEPLAYFPRYNLMLTSKANGIRLKDMLLKEKEKGNNDYARLFERYTMQAACWLAKLHNIHPAPGSIYSIQTEEKKLDEWYSHLSWIYPDFAKQIHDILIYGILEKEKLLGPKCFTLIHGDFHPGNIFVDGSDLTVIDLEASCIFDPAKDLGYFIARLLRLKKKYQLSLDIEIMKKRFLERYITERASAEEEGVLERLRVYEARSYVEILHSKYCIHLHFGDSTHYDRHKPAPMDCQYWMNKAKGCLQGQRY